MTEKEQDVKFAELNVRSQEVYVKLAKLEMEEGYKRLKAQMDIKYESLKSQYQHALLELEEAKLRLTCAKEDADKGFE